MIIKLLIGVIAILLTLFGLLLFWVTYSGYQQRKYLHDNHVELIIAR